MKREFFQHTVAYCILVALLLAFVVGAFFVWPDRKTLRVLFVLLGAGYFSWGVLVHQKSGDLRAPLLLEYFGVAVVAVSVLWLLTI